jgi:CopA family copper-resistance protein
MKSTNITRRRLLQGAGALGALAAMEGLLPSYARAALALPNYGEKPDIIELVIAENQFKVNGRVTKAITINGTVPGPLVRLREGHDTILRVTNHLKTSTSIHWHGVLVPTEMDGVPGVSFPGIDAGKTFEYRYTPHQNGTYWYHSHTGTQEQVGVYGPMIIDPAKPDPVQYDREYIVMFSDWTFESPQSIMRKLKAQGDYFNYQQQTLGTFIKDAKEKGLSNAWNEYKMWSQMRMSPTDLSDVTGSVYTYLLNGMTSDANWTGIFKPGEKVRLRFINAGVMTIHDVRIPGLKLTVVAADGQNVQPFEIDEFRIGVAETYDVIVEPKEDRAYTIFAETSDRSGFVRGTLAPRPGMSAPIPERRPRPLLTMADMGMSMHGMDMGGMQMDHSKMDHSKMNHSKMNHGNMHSMNGDKNASSIPGTTPVPSDTADFGPGNSSVPMETVSRLNEPGTGLGHDGRKVLLYTDLKTLKPFYDQRPPSREIIVYLTGNMERYIWGFDGKKYSEKPDIQFHHGERLRLTLVNYTMMEHPIHMHGMWFNLENGHGEYIPRKHTILVKPAERVSALVTANAPGHWAFHCHLLYHMLMGMMRVIDVAEVPGKMPEESHEIMSGDMSNMGIHDHSKMKMPMNHMAMPEEK